MMITLYPLSIIIGIAVGIGIAMIHYRVGWRNIWDNGDDKNDKTDRTISKIKRR